MDKEVGLWRVLAAGGANGWIACVGTACRRPTTVACGGVQVAKEEVPERHHSAQPQWVNPEKVTEQKVGGFRPPRRTAPPLRACATPRREPAALKHNDGTGGADGP